MQDVCVLMVPENGPPLSPACINDIQTRFQPNATWRWLADGVAAEFELHTTPSCVKTLAHDIRQTGKHDKLDVAIVEVDHRRKSLLVADMDSTMIEQECIDEIADLLGLKPQVAAITERAMRGEIAFEPALRERVALLKGLNRDALMSVAEERLTFTEGGETLIRTMHVRGAFTALVSGGFTIFTDWVASRLGFDTNRANTLNLDGDVLDGTVAEPILGQEAKEKALRGYAIERGILPAKTMAVGDGANDLAMLSAAGLGVAFHAKPAVAEAADVRIDHCDLTALLYIQGYQKNEFAA